MEFCAFFDKHAGYLRKSLFRSAQRQLFLYRLQNGPGGCQTMILPCHLRMLIGSRYELSSSLTSKSLVASFSHHMHMRRLRRSGSLPPDCNDEM